MHIFLKTDGKVNPIATGNKRVMLSVETEGIENIDNIRYEIFCSEQDLGKNRPLIVRDSACRHEYFDGKLFEDTKEYFWTATVFNREKKYRSDVAKFERGIAPNNFVAKWIDNPNFDGRISKFTKKFNVSGSVKKARLYIVGLGFSDAYINGKKTDEYYFKPVLTDFDERRGLNNVHYNEDNFSGSQKTVCYDVFDVKELIANGENVIDVTVGTGWYCNEDKDVTDPSYTFGKPKLIFELHVYTENGLVKVVSDEDCFVKNTNAKSQMFACDYIDFTKGEEEYVKARLCKAPKGELIVNPAENDKVIERILPVKVTDKQDYVEYDFGKNHTGGLYLKVRGKRGATLTIDYYENKKEGELNPITSRWLAYKDGLYVIGHLDQTSKYVLSGDIDEIVPLYHWSCYRYATLKCDTDIEILDLQSLFITSDIERDGYFECSDEFLTSFNNAFILTQRDNMHCAVPSDCPHREKLPYTGDGQLVAQTVTYSFDCMNFYRKWLKDIIDSQGKNGFIAYTAPIIAGGGGFWWSNALVVLPFVIYNFTGDKQVLKDAFEPCKKLVRFYENNHDGDYLMKKSYVRWFLGDWCTPEKTQIDVVFVNTLATYFATEKVIEMCELLGDEREKLEFVEFKENLKKAINDNFFDENTCDYAGGVQGANLMPALFNVASEEVRAKLLQKTVDKYEKNARIDTGIVMTPALLNALSVAERYDIAYDILTSEGSLSFKYMMDGETTIPEFWEKHTNERSTVSLCHPMFGAVLEWVYKHVAGLDITKLCDREITFAPKLIKKVKSSKITKKTEYGLIKCEYKLADTFVMKITVPHGLTAKIKAPLDVIEWRLVKGDNEIVINENLVSVGGGEYTLTGKVD